MQSQSSITLPAEAVKKLCNECLDVIHTHYLKRMSEINLEPERREKFIADNGYGWFRKWFWMSSDADFRERLYRMRQWTREQHISDCGLPMKLFAVAANEEAIGKSVLMNIEDYHYLMKWIANDSKSYFESEYEL